VWEKKLGWQDLLLLHRNPFNRPSEQLSEPNFTGLTVFTARNLLQLSIFMSSYPAYRGPTGHDHDYPYPPSAKYSNPSLNPLNPMASSKIADDHREISRTPSPTPSELEALKTGALDWKTLSNWRFWIRKEWTCSSLPPLSNTFSADVCLFHEQCTILYSSSQRPSPFSSPFFIPKLYTGSRL
jgi:hypothetical protein